MPETLTSHERDRSWLPLLLLGILILVAAVLRLLATHNDLWLDELISLQIANKITSPWQIVSDVHSENNHHLYTLYLYFVRRQSSVLVYRFLSVVFGVALIPAGYWLLARRSRLEAVIYAGLLTCSYPLIHFSSEARGYSGALLGLVVAYAALERFMDEKVERGRALWVGLTYGFALALAVLAHLTACLIWVPLAVGSLVILMRRPERVKLALLWTAINLPPAVVLAGIYFLDLRHLTELGGGPSMTLAHGLGRLLSFALGWPAKDALSVLLVLAPLVSLIVWQLLALRKSGDSSWILLPLIYAMPLACVLFLQPAFFMPRYFLVMVPFLYVPLAMLLARLVQGQTKRGILAVLLALFVAGHSYLYAQFLRVGRGQFTAGLEYIIAHTSAPPLKLESSQDFRSIVELNYYAPRVLGNRQLLYGTQQRQGAFSANWYIFHTEGYEPPGPLEIALPQEPRWYRGAYFGASELSGQAWTIYSHQQNNTDRLQ
jgi:hypothetical protein